MVHFQGDIGYEITIDSVAKALSGEDRSISLSSYGGSLIEGWGIYDYIKANNSVDSITCFGMVASSATIILAAVENRIASPNSRFVIHNPWSMAIGDGDRMAKVAAELNTERDRLVDFYAQLTGKEHDYIKNIMAEERELTATEALELGLITEILNFDDMTKQVTKEDLDKFENSLISKFKNLFKGSNIKNMVVQSTDGTELEFDAGVETTEQIEVGGGLKAGGQPATGEFILPDGTKVTADKGVITAVEKTGGEEDVEALKQKLADAEAKLAEVQNSYKAEQVKNVALNAEITTAKAAITEVQNDFTAFKNQFSDGKIPGNVPPVGGDAQTKFTYKRKNA